jgi:Peptidase family M1 domain
MKLNKLVLFFLLQFFCTIINAQSTDGKANRSSGTEHGISSEVFNRSSGTSGTGANIDVISHKIFWRLNPDTAVKYIKGSVQFNFKTTVNNVTTISFDLRDSLKLDSIRFRANQFTLNAGYTRAGHIVTINLGTTLANNFIDSFIVYYRGVPPAVSGAAQGFQRYADANAGNVINTLSESYEDRDWWPCKHDMQDKIDSMEITVSVPWASPAAKDTFWAATNGRMVDSSIVGNSRIFKFKTKYPIASYLVFVNVARFNRVYRSVNTGTTNVPVVYNLLAGNTARNNAAITAMDNSNLVLQALSAKIGEYPFRLEKHGFADGLQGAGGMEHQTMSSIVSTSLNSVDILVHEMAHQWFGDNVTFAHWNDLWLAEGFAEYSTAWYKELVPSLGGAGSAYTARNAMKNSAISLSSNSAWIPNTNAGTSALIWSSSYGSTVYQRGAMVISMLRTMCGDSLFSTAMTKYQTGMAGKSATTDTLRNYFNRELGRDISVFFDDYVGGSDTITTRLNSIGSPINTVNWNNPSTAGLSSKRLVISLGTQTKTAGSNVTYFRGPIQLHVKGALAANDTTITIFDWGGGNLSYAGKGISAPIAGNRITFDLSFVPTSVLYDDSSRLMSRGSTVSPFTGTTKLTTLDGYVWLGTTSTDWFTATNWAGSLIPPTGGDVTIATAVSNQPILPANVTVGPLTILGANKVVLNGNTMTLNMDVRAVGTGSFTGSPSSGLTIETNAGEIRFDQTSATTRSLNLLTLKPSATATLGAGQLELYGQLILPAKANLTVKSNSLNIR